MRYTKALIIGLGFIALGCVPKKNAQGRHAMPSATSGLALAAKASPFGVRPHCPKAEDGKGQRTIIVAFTEANGTPSFANYLAGSLLAPAHQHLNSQEIISLKKDPNAVSSDPNNKIYDELATQYQQNLVPEIEPLRLPVEPVRVSVGLIKIDERPMHLCIVHASVDVPASFLAVAQELNLFMPEMVLGLHVDPQAPTVATLEHFTENRWYQEKMSQEQTGAALLTNQPLAESKMHTWLYKALGAKTQTLLRNMQSEFSIEVRDFDTPGSALANNFGYLLLNYLQAKNFVPGPFLNAKAPALASMQQHYQLRAHRLSLAPVMTGFVHLPKETAAILQGDDQSMVAVWVRILAQLLPRAPAAPG